MSSTNFDVRGLDQYTQKMYKKYVEKYPQEAEKFLNKRVGKCKAEAIARTPVRKEGKSRNTKKKWKHKVFKKKGHIFGTVKNGAKNIHLIESGHVAENGTWVEGAHMLELTMVNQQPKIDADIDNFIDKMLEV